LLLRQLNGEAPDNAVRNFGFRHRRPRFDTTRIDHLDLIGFTAKR
jgi:hypothetical protein